jgi:outer membrane immunogenic protein
VFGLEAQGDWADLKGSNQSILVPGSFTNDPKTDAFGLFTGQVGWAANNVLFYVKGGAAVTNDHFRIILTPLRRLPTAVTTPAWVAPSAPASNSGSPRTGRLALNTTTCSCGIAP